ncbi:unnamed protein product [Phytomonas sp. Hart1]|nr:unnamed protein product [Phytomonas sp. Hart1]|eukprot:CCW68856.1 unnamed protein product [Phytomonas sp. isolate Hart1]
MTESHSFYTYLPHDAPKRLRGYKYRGEDRSYIYKYLWSALCRYAVKFLPPWLAPNVITITGLAFVCISHAILAYYMPKLTAKDPNYLFENEMNMSYRKEFIPQPPSLVFVLVAASMFLYQFLDNLDGHQARRTGTSSPLGLLVDHGCDAFNCIISSLSIAASVSAGPCWKTWVILLNTVTTFFMNTWEEYYRGILILPIINGPNEGILVAISIYLWTAWIGGPQWWYDNTIKISETWLPEVFRQPAPDAAVAIERTIIRFVCTFQSYLFGSHENSTYFPYLPFIFHSNCSASYVENLPKPVLVVFNKDLCISCDEQIVTSKYWKGHSMLQRMVLRLYDIGGHKLKIRYNTLMVWFMTLAAIWTCAGNIYQVFKAIRRRIYLNQQCSGKDSGSIAQLMPGFWFGRHFPFLYSLVELSPLVVLVFMANVFFFASQENIFRQHPRIFCWTVGLLFTKLTVHLMLAHLCGIEFQPFRRTFLPVFLFGLHTTLTFLHGEAKLMQKQSVSTLTETFLNNKNNQIIPSCQMVGEHSRFTYILDENLILYEFFALSVVTFAHLAWNAVREIASALNVQIFRVPLDKQMMLCRQIADGKARSISSKKNV